MNVHAPFATVSGIATFTPPAQVLAAQSLTLAAFPGRWHYKKNHAYSRDTGHRIIRSQHGAYGVCKWQTMPEAVADMFSARLGAHIDVSVVPVYSLQHEKRNRLKTVSIIPFSHLGCTSAAPFDVMKDFLFHYASTLPFLLLIGNNTDRPHAANRCIDLDRPVHFADFDFGTSDIERLLKADSKGQKKALDHVRGQKNYTFSLAQNLVSNAFNIGTRPILRTAFERTLNAIATLPDQAIMDILEVVGQALPVTPGQNALLDEFLAIRKAGLLSSYAAGHFERLMVDTLPQELPAVRAKHHDCFKRGYRFA